METKRYSTLSRSPEVDFHNQVKFSFITSTNNLFPKIFNNIFNILIIFIYSYLMIIYLII